MIQTKGRYRNQTLELDEPLAIAEGTEVEIQIHLADEVEGVEHEGWSELGMQRLADEWENPADAVYDDWRGLYGA